MKGISYHYHTALLRWLCITFRTLALTTPTIIVVLYFLLDARLEAALTSGFPAFPAEAPAASHSGWDKVTRLLPSEFGKVTTERRHCFWRPYLEVV